MNTKNIHNNPVLRFVSFSESSLYSPWTTRLTEFEDWEKRERNTEEILKEYNDDWYGSLLRLWEDFHNSVSQQQATSAVMVQRFFYQVGKYIADEVEKNKEIYRSSKSQYLFSIGDELAVGDFLLGEAIHQNLIINYVDEQVSKYNLQTVVETGCGTGVNLFQLYFYLALEHFRGGEICPNAVELGNRISLKFDLPGHFQHFDYRNKSDLNSLTNGLSDYILITTHSIEQIQIKEVQFIENILSLPVPPKLVIHFEPVNWKDDSLMSKLSRRYAEKNKYNLDLLETIQKHQNEKHLEILDIRKNCFGLSAFNPTSIICWQPL